MLTVYPSDRARGLAPQLQEMETLKAENLEAWRTKYALEAEVAGVRAQLDGMARQGDNLQQV